VGEGREGRAAVDSKEVGRVRRPSIPVNSAQGEVSLFFATEPLG
jgi:hypothetical protein